jgi:hypothetical protein
MPSKLTAPVYVSTNDKHVICLKVFVELFGRFWSGQEVNVLGYAPVDLADFVTFYSMGTQGTVKDWSADLRIQMEHADEYFIYGTEDIAFYKDADIDWLNQLIEIAKQNKQIGRINLVNPCEVGFTMERNPHYKARQVKDFGDWGLYEQTDQSTYQLTTQLSIWNKEFFLRYCEPGMTPWDFETVGSHKARFDEQYKTWMVYGDKYPAYKEESFAAGEWDNRDLWFPLLSEKLQKEIEEWDEFEKPNIKYTR